MSKLTSPQQAFWSTTYGAPDGPRWEFRWTETKIGQGKTRVDWEVWRAISEAGIAAANASWFKTSCRFYISAKKEFFTDSVDGYAEWKKLKADDDVNCYQSGFYEGYEGTAYDYLEGTIMYGSTLVGERDSFTPAGPIWSGSFEAQHNSEGVAQFYVQMNGYIYDIPANHKTDGSGLHEMRRTIDLSENMPYTACGAPTSVTISPAIQKPGGKITVSWSGAKPGTANAIAKYEIQYKIKDSDQIDSKWISAQTVTSTASSGSTSITLPSGASRGETIVARVKTVGAISNYDSDWKEGGSSKVNSLPAEPTNIKITGITTIEGIDYIPSSGKTISFSATAGEDIDSQTCSVYWSNGINGAKNKISATCTLNEDATIYFWTYDGLEYSSTSISKTIVKNTTPTITLSSSDEFTPKVTVSVTEGQESGNKYTYAFEYGGNSQKQVSDSTTTEYTFKDVRKLVYERLNSPFECYKTYSYKLTVTRNDGIEEVTASIDKSFEIPNFVMKNEFNEPGYFSSVIRVYSPVNNYTPTGATKKDGYYELNTEDKAFGEEVKKLSFNDGDFWIQPTDSITKVKKYNDFNLSTANSPFDVYTGEQFNLSMAWPSDSAYGFDGLDGTNAVIKYEEEELTLPKLKVQPDTVYYSLEGKDFYDSFLSGLPTTTKSILLEIFVENKYGDTYKAGELSIELNFKTDIQIDMQEDKSTPCFYTTSSSSTSFETLGDKEGTGIKQGVEIWCKGEIYAFSKPTIKPSVKYSFNSSTTSLKSEEVDPSPNDETKTFEGEHAPRKKYTFNYLAGTVGLIETVDSKADFKITIAENDTTNEATYLYDELKLVAHQIPKPVFTNVEYNGEYLITATLRLDNNARAIGTIENIQLNGNFEGGEAVNGEITISDSDMQIKWTLKNAISTDSFQISPTISTSMGGTDNADFPYHLLTKQVSNPITVYNIAPTVAYRQNHLGINTRTPSGNNNAVLTINGYKERKVIYLINGTQESQIEIPNDSGVKLVGFIIDGGSW